MSKQLVRVGIETN